MQRELCAQVTPQKAMYDPALISQFTLRLLDEILQYPQLTLAWEPCPHVSNPERVSNWDLEVKTHTLKIQMRRPVPLNMRDYPFPTSMEAWIILDANASACGVEVVEGCW